MVQSLLQHNFKNGFKGFALNHYISTQVVRGKMGTTNVSTERCGERCEMLNGSTAHNMQREASRLGSNNITVSDRIRL